MYRIFCESYLNFQKEFEEDSIRKTIAKPIKLIVDTAQYEIEKKKNSEIYQELNSLLWFLQNNLEEYPRAKAFLWTIEARGIVAEKTEKIEKNTVEQAKLIVSFLKLAYWG